VLVSEFDFDLPQDLIAQEPAARREDARLLCLDRQTGDVLHRSVGSLPNLLAPGDLVVVNNTRVFPARLVGHRVPSGGSVECLLIRHVRDDLWEALVHPGQKLRPGARIEFAGARRLLSGEILERRFFGRRLVRLWTDDGSSINEAVDEIGHVPLPPYIKRPDGTGDRDRYQTVFARERGSIAAPTAGLHFTRGLSEALMARGVEIVEITLHVGYGTFQPVRVEQVEDHRVESEQYEIGGPAATAIERAIEAGRRVVAVGTTTARALETAVRAGGGRIPAGTGTTALFIYPGFDFRVLRGLLTNFHLPQSSLLMLVCALGGRERVLAAYDVAVRERYRFYSYGDAMLIL
jgi:S-adenosylmethionine:tRNA ribosyltransferase-isomerase